MIIIWWLVVSYVLGVITPGEELAEELAEELVPELRIIGGNELEASGILDYPFMASLQKYNKHQCGGTMLSNTMVLTAAHCSSTPDGWTVIAGVVNYKTFDGKSDLSSSKTSIVQSVIRHTEYNTQTILNDIAVWFLPGDGITGFENPNIRTAAEDDDKLAEGHIGNIAGWGVTEVGSNKTSDALKHLEIPIFRKNKCKDLLKGLQNFTFTPTNQICAGDLKGEGDGCQGDSGGPLFIKGSDNKFIVVGISSFGIKCAKEGVPAVYTRVSHYQDFINTSIKEFKDNQQNLINESHSEHEKKQRPKRSTSRRKKQYQSTNQPQYQSANQQQYQDQSTNQPQHQDQSTNQPQYQDQSTNQLQYQHQYQQSPTYQQPYSPHYNNHKNRSKRSRKRRKRNHHNNWQNHNNPWNTTPWTQHYYVGQPAPPIYTPPPPPSPYDPIITGYTIPYIEPNFPYYNQPYFPGY